jgi:membrane protein
METDARKSPADVLSGLRNIQESAVGAGAVAWRAVRNFFDQEGLQWSGAVAFYLILSVPPLLVAAFSIGVVVVGEETARDALIKQVTSFLPAREEIIRQLVGHTIQSSGAAIPISIGFLLLSGSRVFASLISAINVMWREVPDSGFVRRQVLRLLMVLTTGALFALAGAADVAVAVLGDRVPAVIGPIVRAQLIPTVLSAAGLLALFKLIPRRKASWSSALIGAAVGTVLLRMAQVGFTAYLSTLGNFQSAYGPMAGIAVIMTWALVGSAIVLLAAHLVAVLNQAGSSPDDEDRRRAPGDAEESAA